MYYPFKIKKYFKKNSSVRSITTIDENGLRHGQKLSWWDKAHRIPKTISIYNRGKLIRSTKWHLNGNLYYTLNTINSKLIETGYYSNGNIKFNKQYKYIDDVWMKDGSWNGYYKNGNKQYSEMYKNNQLNGDVTYYYYNGNPKAIKEYRNGEIVNNKCYGLYSFIREQVEQEEDTQSLSSSSSNFWEDLKETVDNDKSDVDELDEYVETEKIFEEIEEQSDEDELQKILLESYTNFKTI